MRYILTIGVVVAGLPILSETAQAREYAWCARYDWSTYNCGFVSFEQCLATVRGIGGFCERNPRYAGPPPRQKKRAAPR